MARFTVASSSAPGGSFEDSLRPGFEALALKPQPVHIFLRGSGPRPMALPIVHNTMLGSTEQNRATLELDIGSTDSWRPRPLLDVRTCCACSGDENSMKANRDGRSGAPASRICVTVPQCWKSAFSVCSSTP